MKKHLTAASVERIKPPKAGTMEIFDLGYPGLALRVGHGGAKSFEIFYRTRGKLKRESLGRWPEKSLAQAREAWRKTREAIAKGEHSVNRKGAKTPARLFEHVVEDWLRRDQSKNKKSSVYQVTRSVEANLLPAWRGKRVDQIGKTDVHALLDGIADRGATVMARRVQAYVNRFFGWCIERDILAVNPMAGMERIANGKSRDCIIAAEIAKQKPGQVEPVSVGGRGKVNKLKARVVAKGKQHGVSESTVKRRLAKAAGKKPEARKPKVQIEGFLRFVGMLHGLTQASDPSDEALAGLTKDQRADAIETIDTIMPKLGRLRDRLRLKDGLR